MRRRIMEAAAAPLIASLEVEPRPTGQQGS